MTRIWGPPTADEAGRPKRPVSRGTGGVTPAAGPASPADHQSGAASRHFDPWLIWMGCVHDGADHAVTAEELATGRYRDTGVYLTMCGRTVAPQATVSPPGRPCPACCATLSDLQPPACPRARRPRWLTHLRTLLKHR